MTRLVVVDAGLLALLVAHVVWVAQINRGSRIKNFLLGRAPAGRERWVGGATTAVVIEGLLLGPYGYGPGTLVVNSLVLLTAVVAIYTSGAVLRNRTVDRR